MPKYIATLTKSRVVFRKVTKNNRPMTIIYDRLYRIDESLFCSNLESNDSFVAYDIDEQQPWGHGEYLDPELTKAFIQSLQLGKGKLKKMFDFNMETAGAIIVIMVVAFALVNSLINGTGGGII